MISLSDRLRAHYQECDTCNRDLLLAADQLEMLWKALQEIINKEMISLSEPTVLPQKPELPPTS